MRPFFAGLILAAFSASGAVGEPQDAAATLEACGGTRVFVEATAPVDLDSAAEILNARLFALFDETPALVSGDQIVLSFPMSDIDQDAFTLLLQPGTLGIYDVVADGTVMPAPNEPDGEIQVGATPLLTEADLEAASPEIDDTGAPSLLITFDSAGMAKFADITRDRIGDRIALAVNGAVVSAPRIMSPIEGGQGLITGDFSLEDVMALSLALIHGPLTANLNVREFEVLPQNPEGDQTLCPELDH